MHGFLPHKKRALGGCGFLALEIPLVVAPSDVRKARRGRGGYQCFLSPPLSPSLFISLSFSLALSLYIYIYRREGQTVSGK